MISDPPPTPDFFKSHHDEDEDEDEDDSAFSTLQSAYESFDALGLVCQSLDIRVEVSEESGEWRKVPRPRRGWQRLPSEFLPGKNGLQIVCGERSNLFVLDVDQKDDGVRVFEEWCVGHPTPDTFTVRTQSGGLHLYFRMDSIPPHSPLRRNKTKLSGAGIDVRAEGGCVYAPPTELRTPDGTRRYEVTRRRPIAPIPDWLLELLESHCPTDRSRMNRLSERGGGGIPAEPGSPGSPGSPGRPGSPGSRTDFFELEFTHSDIQKLDAAKHCLSSLAACPLDRRDAVWNNHDATVRIIWACKRLDKGTRILLRPLHELLRASNHARSNLKSWISGVYDQGDEGREDRPGLRTLLDLAARAGADRDAELLTIIRRVHARRDVPTDDETLRTLHDALWRPNEHKDLANYVFQRLHARYRYGFDAAQRQWRFYAFDGALWSYGEAKEMLRGDIDDVVYPVVEDVAREWDKAEADRGVDEEKRRSRVAESLRSKMAQNGWFEALWAKCDAVWKNPKRYKDMKLPTPRDFFGLLDDETHLLGFTNGVYDLERDVFYPSGSVPPTVNVSYSTGYDYVRPDAPGASDKMADIEREVYEKTFPDENTRRQAEAFVGSLLLSGNPDKKLALMLGAKGDNGKSSFMNWFLKETLGQYMTTVPVQVIVGKTRDDADACQPTLANNRKRKLLCLNEGDKRARLNSGVTKMLTGNDDICVRNLYGQPESVRFHAKMVYVSNFPPIMDATDNALFKRMYPIDFISTFSNRVSDDDPAERVFRAFSEDALRKKFREWRAYHMLLMLKWFRKFRDDGYRLPACPETSSGRLALENASHLGPFREFVDETYERTTPQHPWSEGDFPVVSVDDVRSAFNERANANVDRDECKQLLAKIGVHCPERVNNRFLSKKHMAYLRLSGRAQKES